MAPRMPRRPVLVLLLTVGFLVCCGHCDGRTPLSLEREDVFCLYFKLSGQPIGNQDIEDLCFALGKPVYSAFKPVEMFQNPSIQQMRARLLKKIKGYGSDPLFIWKFLAGPRRAGPLHWASEPPEEPPHATPFIRSIISEKGWARIEQAARAEPSFGREPLQVTVLAKAQTIEHLPEKRIVAQEPLRIPVRLIVFHPVEIQVSPVVRTHPRLALQKEKLR